MYELQVDPGVRKALRRIPRPWRERLVEAIDELPHHPRPPGCRKLAGMRDRWRIRVGVYRILYDIYDDRLIIVIVRASHRKDAYRD